MGFAESLGHAALAAIIIIVILFIAGFPLSIFHTTSRSRKQGYLVYPYLDLDEPGERGSYYALSEAR